MLSYIKDRFLRRRIERDEKEIKIGFTATALIIIALMANVAYLNFFIVNGVSSRKYEPVAVVASPLPVLSPTPSPIPSPSQTPVPYTNQAQIPANQATKDYFVNLGSGTNQATDWTDVAGTLSTIDIGQYQNIKEVHLETTINVPTANGTVSVRLFNKTDGYAVWNSERTVQSQINGDLLISQNLIYDVGPKLYQVQMKSQLGVTANLLQSRLHVTVQR